MAVVHVNPPYSSPPKFQTPPNLRGPPISGGSNPGPVCGWDIYNLDTSQRGCPGYLPVNEEDAKIGIGILFTYHSSLYLHSPP